MNKTRNTKAGAMSFSEDMIKVLVPSAMLMENNTKIFVMLNLLHLLVPKLELHVICCCSASQSRMTQPMLARSEQDEVAFVDVEFDSPSRGPTSHGVKCALKLRTAGFCRLHCQRPSCYIVCKHCDFSAIAALGDVVDEDEEEERRKN